MRIHKLIVRATRAQLLFAFVACVAGTASGQTPGAGTVNLVANLNGELVDFAVAPGLGVQQWFQGHFKSMIVYPPWFDSRLSWFPNGSAYFDLYAISPGSWEDSAHPEWILRDAAGNKLYLPWGCGGGTCPEYAADITNPAWRKAWINNTAGTTYGSGYAGVFVDDVNMNMQVSDGNGNPAAPVDSNTGQPMTADTWRKYMATYLEELRAAVPNLKIIHNAIWYAGPDGVLDQDPYIQREIAAADILCLERGVASDAGLQGGTSMFSVYSFFNFIDRVHAAGKGVELLEYQLDPRDQEYGLASYFLISNGTDSIGDASTNPGNWWSGYNVNLGNALGARTYSDGVFSRDFTGGKVLLGEPGLKAQTIDLGDTFTTLAGRRVTNVTLSSRQGIILLK